MSLLSLIPVPWQGYLSIKNIVIGVVLAVCTLALGIYIYHVWHAPVAALKAQVKAEQTLGRHTNVATEHAINKLSDNNAHENTIHEQVRTNYVYINKQPGSGDLVSPDVDRAFRQSICLHDSAKQLPECAGVQPVHP